MTVSYGSAEALIVCGFILCAYTGLVPPLPPPEGLGMRLVHICTSLKFKPPRYVHGCVHHILCSAGCMYVKEY